MSCRQLAVLGVALGLVLTGCAQPSETIAVTGRVSADMLTVQAPTLAIPAGTSPRVVAVPVRLGDQVKAGDVLLRFDDTTLAAKLTIAKKNAAVAKVQVGVVDAGLDTLADKERDLRDKRSEVTDGIAKATKARKDLSGKLADARKASGTLPKQLATVEKNLSELRSKLAGVEQELAQVTAALQALPPDAGPEVREPLLQAKQQLTAVRAQLTGGIATLSTARAKLTAGIAALKKGVRQLGKAIATIDANLVKARDGLRKIDDGLTKLSDARADLNRARTLAVIAAADTTGVDTATLERTQAVVRAPADALVTAVAHVGDVVAPGAMIAELARPASVVTTWLAPEQVAQTCLDAPATVSLDSLAMPASGRVSRIVPAANYPPTYHTTDQVHLTRAVPVEVTVTSPLPPGVPADLRISTCPTEG
ncbi:MAG: biotin/lipoyl-binding protein [Micropruina sp.]|uniref:HlyD family secretion protein n=1 Tax=Micropruina sp. TaxID=2737536 RepID=UPI0039E3937E